MPWMRQGGPGGAAAGAPWRNVPTRHRAAGLRAAATPSTDTGGAGRAPRYNDRDRASALRAKRKAIVQRPGCTSLRTAALLTGGSPLFPPKENRTLGPGSVAANVMLSCGRRGCGRTSCPSWSRSASTPATRSCTGGGRPTAPLKALQWGIVAGAAQHAKTGTVYVARCWGSCPWCAVLWLAPGRVQRAFTRPSCARPSSGRSRRRRTRTPRAAGAFRAERR